MRTHPKHERQVSYPPWRGCATLTSFAPPWLASRPLLLRSTMLGKRRLTQ
ncbi:hypothetical protein MHY1_01428 [Methylovirgula sp. HY1]|nr:hypothetical protein MHY1_01428 [Methylovirgula sp. HY1]